MGLFDVFSASGGKQAAGQAHKATTGGYEQGFDQAKGYINKGTDKASTYYNKALNPYKELQGGYDKGAAAYGDAFGLGGQEGYDRSREAFQTGPGYQFQQEQGLDALNRTANSRGLLSSGNNTQDILKFSQGLADQEWDDYTAGLAPYLNLQKSGADAQSGLYQQLASLKAGEGQQLGNLAYGTQTGIGQASAQLAQDRYGAEQGASQNLWNAILGIGGAAMGAAGNAGGFGKLFG